MQYLRSPALLWACTVYITRTHAADTSYPQFQCDSVARPAGEGIHLLLSQSVRNPRLDKCGGRGDQYCDDLEYHWVAENKNRECWMDACNWKSGKVLGRAATGYWYFSQEDVNAIADCENCPQREDSLLEQKEYDTLSWICPAHCHTMPKMNVKVSGRSETKTWKHEYVKSGTYWLEEESKWWTATLSRPLHVAFPQTPTRTDFDPITITLPGKECPSSGTNCHSFRKKLLYSDQDDPDGNVYSIRPVSICKQLRYESSYNERILSCRKWKRPGEYPTMTHFNDNFWSSDPKDIHTLGEFSGVKKNEQTIPKCYEINDGTTWFFHRKPCWKEEQHNNLHFSIKPFYTAYRDSTRNSNSKRDLCRMVVHGDSLASGVQWPQSYLTDRSESPLDILKSLFIASAADWQIETYWQPTPMTQHHTYAWKSLVGAVRAEHNDFYTARKGEVKYFKYEVGCTKSTANFKTGNAFYYESGCTARPCIDFMTKPCYDNIYRYDQMVCKMIQYLFKTTITFEKFMHDIIPETDFRDPFMAYGRYPSTGPSYFEVRFDDTKVEVRKNQQVKPPGIIDFGLADTILVSLKEMLSCKGCKEPLQGRYRLTDNPFINDIIQCRACVAYEKTQEYSTYQDCVSCDPHHIRNPEKDSQCRKCIEIDRAKPMRRVDPADASCTTCKHFQYFDINTPQGCIFLPTVTDGISVVNRKAQLSGQDHYIKNQIRTEISQQQYRDNINASTDWYAELKIQTCSLGWQEPPTLVKRLLFRSWCGHQEMVRHQQAFVQLVGTTLYIPLNSDAGRTRSNTTVVELCGTAQPKAIQGSTTADFECGQRQFKIIRSGFQDPCTLCSGTRYTKNCWPTYAPGLEIYDDAYFLPANKALIPQPGECAWCNKVCENANHYIAPVEYSCWWNGTGRLPGVLGATATNFSWYKPAPCSKCENVRLTDTTAELILTCGNRVSYRRWLPDDVSDSTKTPLRSIPSIQVCCAEPLSLCTDNELEFETFSSQNCRQSVDDTWPATLPYCPPGWYVDETCAHDNPLWSPDCCVKCKACRGGKFKTDAYYDCPGNQYFDSQDRGCTTSCLTNQYLRNERCIKCEACE